METILPKCHYQCWKKIAFEIASVVEDILLESNEVHTRKVLVLFLLLNFHFLICNNLSLNIKLTFLKGSFLVYYPLGKYLFRVSNKDTETTSTVCRQVFIHSVRSGLDVSYSTE